VVLVIGFLVWTDRTEKKCWDNEVAQAFQKYSGLTSRDKVLKAAYLEKDAGTRTVQVIERDPNGCSLGSNGQTVVRFYFSKDDKLTEMRVYKNYISANYKMEMIGKKVFK